MLKSNKGFDNMKDHDILTAIDTKLDILILNIKDHEKRLRWIERITFTGIGGYLLLKEVVMRFLT